jgi:hypothetical protein
MPPTLRGQQMNKATRVKNIGGQPSPHKVNDWSMMHTNEYKVQQKTENRKIQRINKYPMHITYEYDI